MSYYAQKGDTWVHRESGELVQVVEVYSKVIPGGYDPEVYIHVRGDNSGSKHIYNRWFYPLYERFLDEGTR